jgi:hypothetical protein
MGATRKQSTSWPEASRSPWSTTQGARSAADVQQSLLCWDRFQESKAIMERGTSWPPIPMPGLTVKEMDSQRLCMYYLCLNTTPKVTGTKKEWLEERWKYHLSALMIQTMVGIYLSIYVQLTLAAQTVLSFDDRRWPFYSLRDFCFPSSVLLAPGSVRTKWLTEVKFLERRTARGTERVGREKEREREVLGITLRTD